MAETLKTASFIENTNAIANATRTSTGDVVEDTQRARDEAVVAASQSLGSELNALDSENKSRDWANKGHNNPVDNLGISGTSRYSSYHWSVEAANTIGDPIVNDGTISAVKTWSSQKIFDEVSLKSNLGHNHNGLYEPIISKNTGFNKSFGTTIGTVSQGNHNHDGVYENKINNHGSAFNKDFGVTSNTVSEGNHNHDLKYEPKRTTQGTAYNRNFVTDQDNALAEEIPKGNHNHKASTVVYDPNNNLVVSSSSVQGAIGQLDSELGTITVAEATYITATKSDVDTLAITGPNIPTKVTSALSAYSYKNATNNSNATFTISYNEPQVKKIEGLYTVSVSLDNSEKFSLSMAIDDVIVGGSISGVGTLTLSKYLTGISEVNPTRLTYLLSNLENSTDATIISQSAVWNGSPKGAFVASGISIDHSELTGTGAANGVHTTSDIADLDNKLSSKANVSGDSLQVFSAADGILPEDVVTKSQLDTKASITVPSTPNSIAVLGSDGSIIDSTNLLSDFALNSGDINVKFKIAAGTLDNEAVNVAQLNSFVSTIPDKTNVENHISDVSSNPHNVSWSDVSENHTHDISGSNGVTGLQDKLDSKYNKVVTPVTNNLVSFKSDGTLEDSGVSKIDVSGTNYLRSDVADTANGLISLNGGFGSSTTNVQNDIVQTHTDVQSSVSALRIAKTLTGSATPSGNKYVDGLRVYVEDRTTGSIVSPNGNRKYSYGTLSEIRTYGNAHSTVGTYSIARNYTSTTVPEIVASKNYAYNNSDADYAYGSYNYVSSSSGLSNNMYGSLNKVSIGANSGNVGNAYGVYAEVQHDGTNCTVSNAYAVKAVIDRNQSGINRAYLFYGEYQGTLPTIPYGIFIAQNVPSVFKGQVRCEAPQGTSPLTVTSTTKVTNLNADLLDGYSATVSESNSTIPVRSTSGDIEVRLVKSSYGNTATLATNAGICFRNNNTTDKFMRTATVQGFRKYLESNNLLAFDGGDSSKRAKYVSTLTSGLALGTGFYRIDGSAHTGEAPTDTWYYVTVIRHSASYIIQTASNLFVRNANYTRVLNNGVWSTWEKNIHSTNYATSTVGGTIKIRRNGSDLYITTNGSNA